MRTTTRGKLRRPPSLDAGRRASAVTARAKAVRPTRSGLCGIVFGEVLQIPPGERRSAGRRRHAG